MRRTPRVTHETVNGQRMAIKSHFQPMGLQGYGTVSGSMYNATGVTQQSQTLTLGGGAPPAMRTAR